MDQQQKLRLQYMSPQISESARQNKIMDEQQFLEVRIRGKNRTFAKKKASAFVTLEEQSRLQ